MTNKRVCAPSMGLQDTRPSSGFQRVPWSQKSKYGYTFCTNISVLSKVSDFLAYIVLIGMSTFLKLGFLLSLFLNISILLFYFKIN